MKVRTTGEKIIPVSIPPLLKALPEIVFKDQGWGFSHVTVSVTAGYLDKGTKEKDVQFPAYLLHPGNFKSQWQP